MTPADSSTLSGRVSRIEHELGDARKALQELTDGVWRWRDVTAGVQLLGSASTVAMLSLLVLSSLGVVELAPETEAAIEQAAGADTDTASGTDTER